MLKTILFLFFVVFSFSSDLEPDYRTGDEVELEFTTLKKGQSRLVKGPAYIFTFEQASLLKLKFALYKNDIRMWKQKEQNARDKIHEKDLDILKLKDEKSKLVAEYKETIAIYTDLLKTLRGELQAKGKTKKVNFINRILKGLEKGVKILVPIKIAQEAKKVFD